MKGVSKHVNCLKLHFFFELLFIVPFYFDVIFLVNREKKFSSQILVIYPNSRRLCYIYVHIWVYTR